MQNSLNLHRAQGVGGWSAGHNLTGTVLGKLQSDLNLALRSSRPRRLALDHYSVRAYRADS